MNCLRSVRARLASAALSPLRVCAFVAAALAGPAAQADTGLPGTLDTAFNPFISKVTVYAVAVDGKQRVVYGGDNHTFERLNPDGAQDSNFSFSDFGAINRIVFGLAIDRENRIYAVGGFDPSNNNRRSVNITRFFSDGSRINRGFEADTGANQAIVTVLIQPTDALADNDKILLGGLFTQYRGEDRGRLARINADGTIDRTFDGGLNFDGNVYALALQKSPATGAANGQIVVAGDFGQVNGVNHARLARLNFDGSVDASFQPAVDKAILAVDVQADGKIVIGGQFASVNGFQANGLARLNADGSFDPAFSAAISGSENESALPTSVYAVRVQADGRIVVGGNFLNLNSEGRRFLGRLNADGSVDPAFAPGDDIRNTVEALAIQADNKIVVGQVVTKKEGSTSYPNVVKRVYGDPLPPVVSALPGVSIEGVRKLVENGQKGYFRVFRASDDLSAALTVFYAPAASSAGGQPKAGVDYKTLPQAITIPAGASSAKIKVVPLGSVLGSNGERLKLQLKANPGYTVEGTGEASIRFKNAPAQ